MRKNVFITLILAGAVAVYAKGFSLDFAALFSNLFAYVGDWMKGLTDGYRNWILAAVLTYILIPRLVEWLAEVIHKFELRNEELKINKPKWSDFFIVLNNLIIAEVEALMEIAQEYKNANEDKKLTAAEIAKLHNMVIQNVLMKLPSFFKPLVDAFADDFEEYIIAKIKGRVSMVNDSKKALSSMSSETTGT